MGTRDWYLMHYNNPPVTGGQKHTHQCNFIMAYPQAHIEWDMYMELPQGIQVAEGDSMDYVLKLLKNNYGQKQAG
jgi:hypothetical protein